MGKEVDNNNKNKNKEDKTKKRVVIPNKDAFERISYLYKISKFTNKLELKELSRYYLRNIDQVAEKNVLRVDPSIKNKICKRCSVCYDWDLEQTHVLSGLSYVLGKCPICSKLKKQILGAYQNMDQQEQQQH